MASATTTSCNSERISTVIARDNKTIVEPRDPITPFLKWAGGKRWLAATLAAEIGPVRGKYIEPFLGSAAVYFYLAPAQAILCDANDDLIETYRVVKRAWRILVEKLSSHHRRHSHSYYYKIRSEIPGDKIESAARFIYLNRTCWNGLYRVNLKGTFNVPIGTKSDVLMKSDDFQRAATLLKGATLMASDFELAIAEAHAGDVIFADPPYTVRHKFNGFIKYNENLFSWNDQLRLKDALKEAKQRGARIYLTNADHESIRDLYGRDFEMRELTRYSAISGTAVTRGNFSELLITC